MAPLTVPSDDDDGSMDGGDGGSSRTRVRTLHSSAVPFESDRHFCTFLLLPSPPAALPL